MLKCVCHCSLKGWALASLGALVLIKASPNKDICDTSSMHATESHAAMLSFLFLCSLCAYFLYVIFFKWCCFDANDSHESYISQTTLNSMTVGPQCASVLLPTMTSSRDTYSRCSFLLIGRYRRQHHKYTQAWTAAKGSAMHRPSSAGCWLILMAMHLYKWHLLTFWPAFKWVLYYLSF